MRKVNKLWIPISVRIMLLKHNTSHHLSPSPASSKFLYTSLGTSLEKWNSNLLHKYEQFINLWSFCLQKKKKKHPACKSNTNLIRRTWSSQSTIIGQNQTVITRFLMRVSFLIHRSIILMKITCNYKNNNDHKWMRVAFV